MSAMTRAFALAGAVALGGLCGPGTAAAAGCRISDGQGGALTVSGTPGGAAFGQIEDGAQVTKGELARDASGRSWLFIHDGATGRRLGWVPAGAVRC